MSFDSDLTRFEAKVKGVSEEVIRDSATALFSRIVRGTPVDTGAAKGNWQVEIGAPPTGTTDTLDESGQATISAGQLKAATFTLADRLYFANNLPYIDRLEHGWSEQARSPDGMVAVNVADWDHIVETIAQQHSI